MHGLAGGAFEPVTVAAIVQALLPKKEAVAEEVADRNLEGVDRATAADSSSTEERSLSETSTIGEVSLRQIIVEIHSSSMQHPRRPCLISSVNMAE